MREFDGAGDSQRDRVDEESEAKRQAWDEAAGREAVIRDLFKRYPKHPTIKAVETTA